MCFMTKPRCTPSFPPPFCVIQPWRNEIVPSLNMITGRGTPGVLVRVKIDGQEPELTALVDGNGWWSITLTEALLPGEHTIYAAQFYGNECETFTVPFIVEQPLLPTPFIDLPVNGSNVTAGDITVSGRATAGNSVTLCMDGGSCRTVVVDQNGAFASVFTGIAAGAHVASATESNPLTGQVSLTATSQFTAVA